MTSWPDSPVPTCDGCQQPHQALTITLQSGRRCPDCGQPFSPAWAVETARLIGMGAAMTYLKTVA